MATHFNILAWKIPWTEKPGRLPSMGHKELGTTEQLTLGRVFAQSPLPLPLTPMIQLIIPHLNPSTGWEHDIGYLGHYIQYERHCSSSGNPIIM